VINYKDFREQYRHTIKKFLLLNKDFESLKLKEQIIRINNFLKTETLSKKTINLHRVALKTLVIKISKVNKLAIDYLFKKSVIIHTVNRVALSHKILSKESIELLIREMSPRYALIIKTLWKTGLRVSELRNIKLVKCHMFKEYVEIDILGKYSISRKIPLDIIIFTEIREYFKGAVYLFETQNGKRYDRRNVYNEIRRHGEKILGRRVTPHMMRHSFATYLINERNCNLSSLSKLLGHKTESTTSDVYTHGVMKSIDLLDMIN
jgi:integrase